MIFATTATKTDTLLETVRILLEDENQEANLDVSSVKSQVIRRLTVPRGNPCERESAEKVHHEVQLHEKEGQDLVQNLIDPGQEAIEKLDLVPEVDHIMDVDDLHRLDEDTSQFQNHQHLDQDQ